MGDPQTALPQDIVLALDLLEQRVAANPEELTSANAGQ